MWVLVVVSLLVSLLVMELLMVLVVAGVVVVGGVGADINCKATIVKESSSEISLSQSINSVCQSQSMNIKISSP